MPQSKVATNTKPRRLATKKKSPSLRGTGDYTDEDRKVLKGVSSALAKLDKKIPEISGSKIGRSLGNVFGAGDLGERAGTALSTLFGFGDYEVKSNSLMKSINSSASTVPGFTKDGKRGTRITEREYLGDITSSSTLVNGASAFRNQAFAINPANTSTFPWLSKVAPLFEQWEPHGVVFEFVSTSSEFNGTSQALGTVIMATDYDVYDVVAAGKLQMENYDYSNSCKPSVTAMHGIECDPDERPTKVLYVGTNGPDLRANTLGNFQVATVGCSTANATLGELWVSYDITFYKKQLEVPYGAESSLQLYSDIGISTVTSLLGQATVRTGSNPNLTVTQIVGTGTRISFPPAQFQGVYTFNWLCPAGTSAAIDFTAITFANCYSFYPVIGYKTGTSQTVSYTFNVYITAAGASVLFGLANVGSTGNPVYCDVFPTIPNAVY